jgi:hypothetical protein
MSAGLNTIELKREIRPTAGMPGPVWSDQRSIPRDPPSKVAVPRLTILGPPGFSICFQWFLITALPVPQGFSDLVVPEVKVISHGCRYGLLFIVRLDDDLYLDAEVVEGHIVFDDYHCWNGSAGDPITYISKGKAVIILQ